MNFTVRDIPHASQRYPTVGDWIASRGHLRHVLVSNTGHDDYNFLVALHEQIEAWLCLKRGITQECVDAFDQAFEAARPDGNTDEPGDAPDAPYRREHRFAESIERLVAHELGVDWAAYEAALAALE